MHRYPAIKANPKGPERAQLNEESDSRTPQISSQCPLSHDWERAGVRVESASAARKA